jgi:tetratricopeptide (TPR) repeat protein
MVDIDKSLNRKKTWRHVLRFALALAALLCVYRLVMDSAKFGIARLLTTLTIVQMRTEPVDTAIKLTPADPETHYTRALTLVNINRLDDAVSEFQIATRLRPHHYYEWLDLGVTLDRVGDRSGAAAALTKSIRLAPFFAQPHWQMGNLLFRQGQYNEAFNELRLAVKGDPNLMWAMLGLAWVAADGNVETVEDLIKAQSNRNKLELAMFLVRHGKGTDGARIAASVGKQKDADEVVIVHAILADLLRFRQFSEANTVWAINHDRAVGTSIDQFLNGTFVEPISQNDPGFGWQTQVVPNVSVSIDPAGPSSGTRSVCLQFGGDSNPASQVVEQLILVRPKAKYSLGFMAKADNLVSGGLPLIVVSDASREDQKVLSTSKPLGPGNSQWISHSIDFSTEESTSAIKISLQRLPCAQSPCPVFGRLWLSGFTLSKV